MSLGKHKRTERGFELVEFTDVNGRDCSLQQSSAIGNHDDAVKKPGSSFVWLGINGEKRMHLNQEQVKGLVERLQQWLATGGLE